MQISKIAESIILNGINSLDSSTGWLNESSDNSKITWRKNRSGVQKVQLIFRDSEHSQIADLKIFYSEHPDSKSSTIRRKSVAENSVDC